MRQLILILAAAAMLAACGGATSAKTHRAAVDYCTFGDVHGGGSGDRPSCECAVRNAEAQGYTDARLLAEMRDSTVLSDKKLIAIALLCAGR